MKQIVAGLTITVLILCLLFIVQAQAAVITVNTLSDTSVGGDGECMLREAVTNANADADSTGGDCVAGSGGDVIEFSVSGVILLNGSQLPVVTSSLTVAGPGANLLTIDAGGQSRIFEFDAVTGIISGMTLTGGSSSLAEDGGAVYADGGDLLLLDCVFENNHTTGTTEGGAVAAVDGDLSIDGCVFSNNSTTGDFAEGGAVLHKKTSDHDGELTLSIQNSRFSNNSTNDGHMSFGGAVAVVRIDDARVSDSEFIGNSVNGPGSGGGGALSVIQHSSTPAPSAGNKVEITGSTFTNNFTAGPGRGGGAVEIRNTNAKITQSSFTGNHTDADDSRGGAVLCTKVSGYPFELLLSVSDSGFENNSTSGEGDGFTSGGGALACGAYEVSITHSEFINNTTGGIHACGGAVYTIGATETLISNSRFHQNATFAADARGGAVCSGFDGEVENQLRIIRSEFTGNQTSGTNSSGGAVDSFSGAGMEIADSLFAHNRTLGSTANGGAVFSYRDVLVRGSTFHLNHTEGTNSDGGAVTGFQDIRLSNNSFAENSTSGVAASGGAVAAFIVPDANFYSFHNSFVDNSVEGDGSGGGAISHPGGNLFMANNLLAGNSPDHCALSSDDVPLFIGNLSDTGECANEGTNTLQDFLGPLADNGGPTPTHALLAGSPAIDIAPDAPCLDPDFTNAMDQRGATRPEAPRSNCDVGAYEAGHQVLETTNESDDNVDVDAGEDDVLVMDFAFERRDAGGDNVQITQLVLRHCLSADLKPHDLDRLAVWKDGGDGQFDAGLGDDLLIDDDAAGAGPGGSMLYTPPSLFVNLMPSGLVADGNPTERYYVSIDVDGDLFASNQTLPGWSQTAYATSGRIQQGLPLAVRLALILASLFLISLLVRDRRLHGLRMLLLAGFAATVLTACPDGGNNNNGGGQSPEPPNPAPTMASFCLSLLEVEARTADAVNQVVPVAGLPLQGSQVNISE